MVMQLLMLLGMGVLGCLIGLFFLVMRAMAALKLLAEQAILASKATSAQDFAQAREYSEDAAQARAMTKDAAGGVQDVGPQDPVYTTPDGTQLKVLKPF